MSEKKKKTAEKGQVEEGQVEDGAEVEDKENEPDDSQKKKKQVEKKAVKRPVLSDSSDDELPGPKRMDGFGGTRPQGDGAGPSSSAAVVKTAGEKKQFETVSLWFVWVLSVARN